MGSGREKTAQRSSLQSPPPAGLGVQTDNNNILLDDCLGDYDLLEHHDDDPDDTPLLMVDVQADIGTVSDSDELPIINNIIESSNIDHPPQPQPQPQSDSLNQPLPIPQPLHDQQHQQTNLLELAGDLLHRIDPEVSNTIRHMGWQVLERFSRVTRSSRHTATAMLDHPLTRPILPILPTPIQALSTTYTPPPYPVNPVDEVVKEFEAASLYLARWVSGHVFGPGPYPHLSNNGRTTDAFPGGFDFLNNDQNGNGSDEGSQNTQEWLWEEADDDEGFQVISTADSLPKPKSKRDSARKLTAEKWCLYIDSNFTRRLSSSNDTVHNPTLKNTCSRAEVITEIQESVFYGDVDQDIRMDVWKFLFGYMPWDSTQFQRKQIKQTKGKEYERMKQVWQSINRTNMAAFPEEWDEWNDRRHRVVKDVIRTDRNHDMFANPLESTVTNLQEEEALHPDLYAAKRVSVSSIISSSSASASTLPSTGINTHGDTTTSLSVPPIHSPLPTIEVTINENLRHLHNVLMTYIVYQNENGRSDIGYVQGMSDLCSPILILMQGDEADTFWIFTQLMEHLYSNFHANQLAMHRNLSTLRHLIQFIDPPLYRHFHSSDALTMFFAFRWLLVVFKREFDMPDVYRLWETIYASNALGLCNEYQLFISLAILDAHREIIMTELHQFDEILKYINELSYHVPVESTLQRAEELLIMFRNKCNLVLDYPISTPIIAPGPTSMSSSGTMEQFIDTSSNPVVRPVSYQHRQNGSTANIAAMSPNERMKYIRGLERRAQEKELALELLWLLPKSAPGVQTNES